MSRRVGRETKRAAFIVGGMWVCFHLFAVVFAVTTGQRSALVAALVGDGQVLLFAALWAAARKVFPDEPRGDR